jgi:hypothetical protein
MEQLAWQVPQSRSGDTVPAADWLAAASSALWCWWAWCPRCCTVASWSCAQYDPVAAQDSCSGIHIINTTSSQERMVEL